MGPELGYPGKGKVFKQTAAKACGNCGLYCGLDEAFSQSNTGKNVLSAHGLGVFCRVCYLPSLVVRGGILEHLLSLLEHTNSMGSAWRQRSCLLGPGAGMELPGSPGGGNSSSTCPVKQRPSCSPQL